VDKTSQRRVAPQDAGSLEPFMMIILTVLGVINLLRGAVHWVAPDSGAGSIAGMDLTSSSSLNIVFLLATDGISQFAWGALYLYIALRERRFMGAVFLLEALKSGAILFTEYVTKPPVAPLPGRYLHITTFVTTAAIVLLSLRQTTDSVQEFP
jgi:hypothetical protein